MPLRSRPPVSPVVPLLGAVILLAALWAPAHPAGAATTIFSVSDPAGDDHGDGSLVYPLRPDMVPGDLDLLALEALEVEGGTLFRATFARPVRRPGQETIDGFGTRRAEVARFGFYTFNLDLYIDTDREAGSGHVHALPGRGLEVSPESAWEKAVSLTPRPHVARRNLRAYELRSWKERQREEQGFVEASEKRLRKAQIDEELVPLVWFPRQVRVVGPRIEFVVPDWFLGGPARADWGYAVVVTGAGVQQRSRVPLASRWTRPPTDGLVLPVEPGRPQDAFGGGREGDDLQSAAVDVLLPAAGRQEEVLRRVDRLAGRPAQLPAVVPAELTRAPD